MRRGTSKKNCVKSTAVRKDRAVVQNIPLDVPRMIHQVLCVWCKNGVELIISICEFRLQQDHISSLINMRIMHNPSSRLDRNIATTTPARKPSARNTVEHSPPIAPQRRADTFRHLSPSRQRQLSPQYPNPVTAPPSQKRAPTEIQTLTSHKNA